MVKILREADKTPLAEVAKKHGVSEATLSTWRKRFVGTMDVPDAKRLKALEAEDGRLKRIVAERDLEIEVTKETVGLSSTIQPVGGGPSSAAITTFKVS
jgi:putative transposase